MVSARMDGLILPLPRDFRDQFRVGQCFVLGQRPGAMARASYADPSAFVELGGLERAIAQVKRADAVTVPVGPKSRGHQTLRIAETWQDYVRQLLDQTGAF